MFSASIYRNITITPLLHDKIGKGYVNYEADKAPMALCMSDLNKIKLYRQGKNFDLAQQPVIF